MSKKYKGYRLDLDKIITSLMEVQAQWPHIKSRLIVQREDLTDDIIQNMVAAYKYIDDLAAERVKIFEDDQVHHLLEMNHIVLCGKDPVVRMEYNGHLHETRRRFYNYIGPIRKWYKHHKDWSAVKLAAQIYVGVLSRPQLFFEGNHRTGSLLASYILMTNRKPPFVLNADNALAYFNPSSEIKFSNKQSIKGKLKLPKYEKAFKRFLEEHIDPAYILG